MRQAVYRLKIRNELTVNDEMHEFTNEARSAMLALIKAQSAEISDRERLLDKETACCNLATD